MARPLHGVEFVDPGSNGRLVPYWGITARIQPIGSLLIADNVFQAKRVAVVGLGTGTLAMYAKPFGCPIDYWRMNWTVMCKPWLPRYFWYLASMPPER